jgi:hypothetical protein
MENYCTICMKNYKSYKSLWKHNYIYHKSDTAETTPITPVAPPENRQNTPKNKCNLCNIVFTRKDSLTRHINKNRCKNEIKIEKIEKIEKENLEIKEEMLEYKKENLEIKKEMEKLKEMLQKSLKIHPKTLNKINSQLNNNGVINNINIVQLGRENLSDILSNKEKRGILNRQVMGLNDLVELVHISGKYKKFMNVYITNLQNTIAYKFDEKMNNFIAVNKNELLNDLVDARLYDIEKFFEEIGPTLDSKKSDQIRKFIERMNNEEDELKGIKKEEIKLVLYNNLAKIKTNNNEIPDIIKIEDNNIDV